MFVLMKLKLGESTLISHIPVTVCSHKIAVGTKRYNDILWALLRRYVPVEMVKEERGREGR